MGTVWSYENATYFPFYKTFDNSCSNSEDNTGCIFSTKSVIIETNEDGNVLSYSLNTRYDQENVYVCNNLEKTGDLK